MENGEEDEKCVDDERDDVGERGEREGHLSQGIRFLLRVAAGEPDGVGVQLYVVASSAFFSLLLAVVVTGFPVCRNLIVCTNLRSKKSPS